MSHHIYTTPGFIVFSTAHAEAGRYYLVFTRDFGMVGATAQGVRLAKSKLRYYTQDFSYSLFSLVRGKEVWRMIGAKEIEGVKELEKENQRLFVTIVSLLKRLLPGEEKNERLFEVVAGLHAFLCEEKNVEKELVEYLTVLRIINALGYVRSNEILNPFCSGIELNKEILEKVKEQKDFIIKEINEGLKESQL